MSKQTVVVLFDVRVEDGEEAERIVDQRLGDLRILWENDSSDAADGTLDPIMTYVVVPAVQLLDESI